MLTIYIGGDACLQCIYIGKDAWEGYLDICSPDGNANILSTIFTIQDNEKIHTVHSIWNLDMKLWCSIQHNSIFWIIFFYSSLLVETSFKHKILFIREVIKRFAVEILLNLPWNLYSVQTPSIYIANLRRSRSKEIILNYLVHKIPAIWPISEKRSNFFSRVKK